MWEGKASKKRKSSGVPASAVSVRSLAGGDVMRRDSLKKFGSVIGPFLVYYVVHDLASVLLAFLFGLSLVKCGEGYREFMEAHAGAANGVMNGLALCIGALAVLPMAAGELAQHWANHGEYSTCYLGNAVPGADGGKKGFFRRQEAPGGGSGRKVLAYCTLTVCAVSLAVGMNLLLLLAGAAGWSEQYTEVSARQYGVGFGLGLILYGLVSPLAEETVFRGVIYNWMKRYLKTGQAIFLCGVLFGIYHGNLVQGIYGCVLGVVITAVYEWFGDIRAAVLFHGAANAAVFMISYDAGRMEGILTPFYCVLFLALAILSIIFLKCITQRNKGAGAFFA